MQIRKCSTALQKKAEDELTETPSKVEFSLKSLRQWLKEQPHLHSVQPTDQWLIAFLRGCKYDIEKCKGKIDMYYTLKTTMPEFYANRDPFDKTIQELLSLGVYLPLKCIKDDSAKPVLVRIGPFSSTCQHHFRDLVKVCLMILEILLLEDDNVTISGQEPIPDLNGLAFRIILQWTPAFAMKIATVSEKTLCFRLKALHLINAPFGIGGAMSLFKMVLGAKLRNRIFSHSKDSLLEHIDRSVLPEEYGGTDGSLQELIDFWKNKVESYRDWFMDEHAIADESKRPVKKNTGYFGWF